jgi:hypothetical protein
MTEYKRTDFSNKQKAQIYERDRAICAFSGKSLWILDYGVNPLWDYDWADHIKPSKRGGESSLENGICSGSFFNKKKRDNSWDNIYFFKDGKPTSNYYFVYGEIPASLGKILIRNKKIHFSDWYLNRAFASFMIMMGQNRRKNRGKTDIRGEEYYAKASLKMLNEWRKIAAREKVEKLEDRSLVPTPVNFDQNELLSLREIHTVKEIIDKAVSLYPVYDASVDALNRLSAITSKVDAMTFTNEIEDNKDDKYISKLVKSIIINNLKLLFVE